MDLAARVALQTAIDFLRQHGKPERVRFVLFDAGAYGAFAAALEELAAAAKFRPEGARYDSPGAKPWGKGTKPN